MMAAQYSCIFPTEKLIQLIGFSIYLPNFPTKKKLTARTAEVNLDYYCVLSS
jgi:hypothetical protein